MTREVFSGSREYFVRVIPGESTGDTVGFSGAKKGKYAAAEFYRRSNDRSYKLAAEITLLNPVAPAEFFVSDAGGWSPSIIGITSVMAKLCPFTTCKARWFALLN